jgi:23S rRNA (uracil1939-C5)-methyltransferase
MHLDYAAQLELKREKVSSALKRIGKIDAQVEDCIPSPAPFHYRNKIQLPYLEVEGKGRLGLYARGSHQLVTIDSCLIHHDLGEAVFCALQDTLAEVQPRAYVQGSGRNGLRHVLLRSSLHQGQVLVVLVGKGAPAPAVLTVARRLRERCPELAGVLYNRNDRPGNAILGPGFELLEGKDRIEEQLNGLTFELSGPSFFQVNPPQAASLYQRAIQLANLDRGQHVIDAYCGVGTLSLHIAQHVDNVLGIEYVEAAVKDAQRNAERNQLSHARFLAGLVEEKIHAIERVDCAFLNPPRKGCDPAVLKSLLSRGPQRIIYISCEPATLARDLAILHAGGYNVDHVQPFDMFPQTMHVETVVRLIKAV